MHDSDKPGSIDTDTLETCPGCGSLLRDTTPEGECPICLLGAGVLNEAADDDETLAFPGPEPGTRLGYVGDYELVEEIGRGGMGVVYRATQASLDRSVAVKLLLGGSWASEEARQRFLLEARAAATIQHAGIVTVHEVGEHEGQPYFSMDLIEGEDLGQRLQRGVPSPEQAALWMRTISDAVGAAHRRGVVHRDLKPSNIILDRDRRPYVTDFGLARVDGGNRLPVSTLTGNVLGTPGYLAPERLAGGSRGDVTGDVYSLGAMLYALLTGAAPFVGESVLEALRRASSEEPIPPRQINPAIPADLNAICVKCLARDPRDRYQSAGELARDLERFLADRPVTARPVPFWSRGYRALRRHRIVAAGLSIVVGLSVLAVFQVLNRQKAIREAGFKAERQERHLNQWIAVREQRDQGLRAEAGKGFAELAAGLAWTPAAERAVPVAELLAEGMAIWRLPVLKKVATQRTPGFAVAFSRDGDRVALLTSSPTSRPAKGSRRGELEIRRTADGGLIERTPIRLRSDSRWMDLASSEPVPAYPAAAMPSGGLVKVFDPYCGCLDDTRLPADLAGHAPELLWTFEPRGAVLFASPDLDLYLWQPRHQPPTRLGVKGWPMRFLSPSHFLYWVKQQQVFDLSLGRGRPRGPGGQHLALSADGSTALLGPENQPLVWDVAGQRALGEIGRAVSTPNALLSPNGQRLAVFDPSDRRLRVWHSPRPSRAPVELEGAHLLHLSPIALGRFSPDGRFLALPVIEDESFSVLIWNAASGQRLFRLDGQITVLWNPNGRGLATFGNLGEPPPKPSGEARTASTGLGVTVWSFDGGPALLPISAAPEPYPGVDLSIPGEILAGDERWRQKSAEEPSAWRQTLPIPGLSPRPGTRREWLQDGTGSAVLLEISTPFGYYTVDEGSIAGPKIRVSRAPLLLIRPSESTRIDGYEVPGAAGVVELEWQNDPRGDGVALFPDAYAFSAGGSVLWTAGTLMRPTARGNEFVGFTVDLWDSATGKHRSQVSEEQITRLLPSPDGRFIAAGGVLKTNTSDSTSGGDDGSVQGDHGASIWRVSDGGLMSTLAHQLLPSAMTWDAEGLALVSGDVRGLIEWTCFDAGMEPRFDVSWTSGLGRVQALAQDPTTGRLLAGDDQGVLLIFKLEDECRTARELYRFDLLEAGIHALGVHPSSSLTAIGDERGRLHLFDLADFESFLGPSATYLVHRRVSAGKS